MCVEKCSNYVLEARVEDAGGCINCEFNYILTVVNSWNIRGVVTTI